MEEQEYDAYLASIEEVKSDWYDTEAPEYMKQIQKL